MSEFEEKKKSVPPPKPRAAPRSKPKIAPEDKEIANLKRRRAQHQRLATSTQHVIARKVKAKVEKAVDAGDLTLEAAQEALDEVTQPQKVIFEPNPGPQTDFLASPEQEVFFGGAKGGGKSYAILVDPLRFIHSKHHRALILRRTMPELRDLIAKSQFLYTALKGKWREDSKQWTFPSGARIEFGYADNLMDAMRYHGQSYTWIGVDELPQFPTPDIWNLLRSCLRSVDPEVPTRMRATGNPGNPGSAWVKEMFIDPAPPNTRFTITVKFNTPEGPREKHISRKYVPSRVWDNPYLTYDDSYAAMLASLPEVQRRQFLEGDWDVYDGAAFTEFKRDIHVVDPMPIPEGWVKFRACDWGYSSPACCLWFAVDYDNVLWVYRELYTKGLTADLFAAKVLELEAGENISYGILDASTWAQRGDVGPSIAETMIKAGCRWRPSDRSPKSRKNGKLEVHRRLANDPLTEQPRAKVFRTCANLIRTLPILPLASNDPEDIDTTAEDHAYDAFRYGCMSRPVNLKSIDPNSVRQTISRYAPSDPVFGY